MAAIWHGSDVTSYAPVMRRSYIFGTDKFNWLIDWLVRRPLCVRVRSDALSGNLIDKGRGAAPGIPWGAPGILS